jgi:DNA-binding transcriptional MerR regulator
MQSPDTLFELAELCDQADVTVRTVRYYIQQGLLPNPGAGREARKYGLGHLHRLRLIRQLQKEHLPLAEIRQRLSGLSDTDVASLVAPSTPTLNALPTAREYLDQILGPRKSSASAPSPGHTPESKGAITATSGTAAPVTPIAVGLTSAAAVPDSPGSEAWPQAREQWEHLVLHDDVELHIRRPASRDLNRRIERLLEIARRILHDN